jgi:hypothetical protein
VYFSDTDLTAFINRAMQQRDWDTGENRSTQSITLIVGQGTYNYSNTVGPPAFSANTIDVLGIVLLNGNSRLQLGQVSYTELGSILQPYQGYKNIPVGFAKKGAGTIVIAPAPQIAYGTEWDTLRVSTPLVLTTDADPLPYPWTDPVPFLAAHFARLELQQYDEADQYLKLYQQRLSWVMGGARGMGISQPYAGMGMASGVR